MIHIDFQEPDTDSWRAWREKCVAEQTALNEAVAAGRRPKVNSVLYKAKKFALRDGFYFDPRGPFHGKCAYCEVDIYRGQHGDMEHFRPHGRVTDEDGKPICVEIEGKTVQHPGYYWLAYDWTNLLPSCALCNQLSTSHSEGRRIGKSDRFPVKHFRARLPGEEDREEPLLIHPVFEHPERYLKLNDVCAFEAGDDRAEACISIFGLNDRDLPNARMEVYRKVRQLVGLFCQAMNSSELQDSCGEIIQKLRKWKDGWGEHTSAARKAIQDAFASVANASVHLGD